MHWKKYRARAARAHEAAAARYQLRHGRAVAGARPGSPPADRQRNHRAAQAELSARSGSGAPTWCKPPCWSADRERRRLAAHITTSPNQRTLYNFPMQSGGAEMLRLATVRLCEAGIVPIMLIHDGILFEETDPEKIEHAKEIMRAAGRDVCDGFEIGVDVDQMLVGGARYRDKRPMAQKMWATIMDTLQTIGVLPRREVA